jgi:hypothetical protein
VAYVLHASIWIELLADLNFRTHLVKLYASTSDTYGRIYICADNFTPQVQMAKEAGAKKVLFVSCSPEIRYPHVVSPRYSPLLFFAPEAGKRDTGFVLTLCPSIAWYRPG